MRIKKVKPKAWYDIPGHEGYQINCMGEIRKTVPDGYKDVKTNTNMKSGKRTAYIDGKKCIVMSLMRITFFGALPDGYVTYHKNGVTWDDELTNIGVIKRTELGKICGKMNRRERRIEKVDRHGEVTEVYRSQSDAARKNGIDPRVLQRYISGDLKGMTYLDGYLYRREN